MSDTNLTVADIVSILKDSGDFDPFKPLSNGQYRSYTSRHNKDTKSFDTHILPSPLENFPYYLEFFESKGIKTVGDFITFLNTLGYNYTLEMALHFRGIYFSGDEWKWYTQQDHSARIVDARVEGLGDGPLVFRGIESPYSSFAWTVVFERDYPCSAPKWMCEKQHYKFVPEAPVFHSLPREQGKLYFGLEFEVVTHLNFKDIQRVVTDVEPVQEPFFYFKHDGSIEYCDEEGEASVEIVTLPCTARFLRKNLRLFFSKLDKLGLSDKVDTNVTCGVHVHLSKEAFYSNFHRKKFVALWNQFESTSKSFIQKLGKRSFTSYCKNADAHNGFILSRRLKTDVFADGSNADKYSASRETSKTVEVRVFKGDFTLDHIIYCLDVTRAMFAYSDKMALSDLKGSSFKGNFLSWLRRHPNFNTLKKELL